VEGAGGSNALNAVVELAVPYTLLLTRVMHIAYKRRYRYSDAPERDLSC
jgi:hypothetical protein